MSASATRLPRPAVIRQRAHLFIDVQHGLCNRLRALSSAAAIAEATNRQLVVVWRPDHHCEARIGDLLRYPGPIIEDDTADLFRLRSGRVYNYMEIEPGAEFDAPILADGDPGGDIYIRSAYTLKSPFADMARDQSFLRSLVPAATVSDLIAQVARPFDVAAHIRMATGPDFEHLSFESSTNWPPDRHRDLIEWRQKSDVSRFVTRLDRLFAQGAGKVFVAADLAATYAALHDHYGSRMCWLPRDCFDRSPRQLQYALADLMLLTAAPLLLASHWSSFSDLAQRLSRPFRAFEKSGIDF